MLVLYGSLVIEPCRGIIFLREVVGEQPVLAYPHLSHLCQKGAARCIHRYPCGSRYELPVVLVYIGLELLGCTKQELLLHLASTIALYLLALLLSVSRAVFWDD